MRKAEYIALGFVILAAAVGFYFYPRMPEMVASHWNARGVADGYMPRGPGLFLFPVIMAVILLILWAVPRVDPRKANIEQFRGTYDGFMLVFSGFMFYIHLLTIVYNTGHRFDMSRMMAPGMAVLFFYSGVLIGKARPNYSVGIRTPWTLHSEAVWDKTHQLGVKVFKASGIIALLGMFVKDWGFLLVIGPVLAGSLWLVVYSYVEFRNETKRKTIVT